MIKPKISYIRYIYGSNERSFIHKVNFSFRPSNENGCLNSTFKLLIGTKQTGSTMAARNLRRLHNISHYDRTKLHQTYYWYPWYRSR